MPGIGWSIAGAGAVLADLAASNLLLVPLHRQGRWYRYHHLFRDMLLAELERLDPELIPVLRRRVVLGQRPARGSAGVLHGRRGRRHSRAPGAEALAGDRPPGPDRHLPALADEAWRPLGLTSQPRW